MSDLTVVISPRFYETDAQGHISNVSIVGWFEAARTSLLTRVLADDVSSQVQWMLANVNIDYLAETYFGSDVTIVLDKVRVDINQHRPPANTLPALLGHHTIHDQ